MNAIKWVIVYIVTCKCAGNPRYISQLQNVNDHYVIKVGLYFTMEDKPPKVLPKEGDTLTQISERYLLLNSDTLSYRLDN